MRIVTKLTTPVLGLLLAVTAMAQPRVSVQGQSLVVEGLTAENGAILRVLGPGGYRYLQAIASEPYVTVDLLKPLEDFLKASEEEPPAFLPSGLYHYELVSRPDRETTSGSFQIGFGVLTNLQGGADVNPLLNESDGVEISDAVDDGNTFVNLDSDAPSFDQDWAMENDGGLLKFRTHSAIGNYADDSGATRVSISRADPSGIGIGTEATLFALDVQSQAPIVNLTDTDGGANWKLINDAGTFSVSGPCVGGGCGIGERWNVVVIEEGAQENSLVIDSSGVALSSSRTVKTNIEPAASSVLLEKLVELPIYTWSYANDSAEAKHVGPMAEDVHGRFGFGSDAKLLSPMDTGGLALAAIQALKAEYDAQIAKRDADIAALRDEKDVQIAKKDAEIAALNDRIVVIEKLISSQRN